MQVKVNAKRLANGHGGTADAASDGASTTRLTELDADILRLCKELQRFEAPLPPDSALFHAADRHAQVAQQPAVDPPRAGVDRGRHAMGAGEVGRPDGRRQAVARGVGEGDRLLLGVERRDGDDWAKDLLLKDAAVAPQAGDDRRLDEEARAPDAPAAGDDRAALVLRQLDIACDLLEMRGADQCADVSRLVERITDAELSCRGREALYERVVDRPLDEDARAAEADLPLVPEARADGRSHGLIEVGVGEDQVRILPPKLQR